MTDNHAGTNQASRGWTDEKLQTVMGTLLRFGVTLSAACMIGGAVLYLWQYGRTAPDYGAFRGEPSDLRHLSGIVTEALAQNPRGIMQLGLLVLIATPVVRVALSVIAFFVERDWLYVAVTVVVLGLLLFGMSGV